MKTAAIIFCFALCSCYPKRPARIDYVYRGNVVMQVFGHQTGEKTLEIYGFYPPDTIRIGDTVEVENHTIFYALIRQ